MNNRPENMDEFRELAATSGQTFTKCVTCERPFTNDNVKTAAGWRETQITGICEECFDSLFEDDEDIDEEADDGKPF